MKRIQLHLLFLLLLAVSFVMTSFSVPKQKKVLVFSKTAGFRHTSAIEAGKIEIGEMGKKNKFAVDTTESSEAFTVENLKQYAAVIFLCTTGDVLNEEQQKAFEQFIRNGGGYVGLHSAADTEYDWEWFGGLNGAYFKNHPRQQEAVFNVVNSNHIATAHLPKVWKRFDELYNFKWIGIDLNVLITIDENSYSGGGNGYNHPMAWYHEYDGGRGFYTALGHDNKSWQDPLYQQHVLGGIKYVIGASSEANSINIASTK
ncbi:ThuA domain-containing protein [Chitinophagaceae bacterium LB-8]|uniref:ThuA domain-containing protein n=1 Tax=Paraflavisolibacter caeni TaxID=2982496 RepID=A0A9X2Y0F2_9BACT|nr:ThuA domain-containing protein [Paraflavisolibacter caeni]MCU7552271.1 ThuA domain-containing protein [Paraflavisolibacter caeni]